MPIKTTETFTAELLCHLLNGLRRQLRADFKNEHPDPRLKSNYTAKGAEAMVEFKGVFYKITVEPQL